MIMCYYGTWLNIIYVINPQDNSHGSFCIFYNGLDSTLIQCIGRDINSVQFSSVAQSCPTLCDPMNHSTTGLPVHQQLLEFTQTHVH